MASNQNKFIDRNPSILAAGKLSDNLGVTVSNLLKEYKIDDATSALKYVAHIDESATRPKYKTEPYKNKMRHGIFTDIRPILQLPVHTRYETLINELKETTYDSHWNKVVGKVRDPTPGLPKGLDPLQNTFGFETKKDESIKELINPSKNVYQVLSESQIGHELYKKTHNDYNPGERVCRNYLSPAFDSEARFGKRTAYDPRGIWVKCACTWHKHEPAVFTNKIQADFLNKKRSRLGEAQSLNNIAGQLPKDFVYGKSPKKDLYSVEDLLKDSDCPPCEFKRDLKSWLSSFNKLKMVMKKRVGPDFSFECLFKSLLYYDVDRSGTLPLDAFYQVCACHRFTFDRENLEPLLGFLSIIYENRIDYGRFLEIIDRESSFLMKILDIPENNLYYVTTNQAAACDHLIIDNTEHRVAGVPSIRYDLSRPIVPHGGCRADSENLGDECSASILINPSIFFNYGLSFRDFFMPREKHVIRSLFEKIGYKLDDGTFEELWNRAVDLDKTGLVCVDTFNMLLKTQYNEHKNIVVDEATC